MVFSSYFLNHWIFNLLWTKNKKIYSVLDRLTMCYLPTKNKTLCFVTRYTMTIIDTHRTSYAELGLWQLLKTVCFDRGDLKYRLRSVVKGCFAFRKAFRNAVRHLPISHSARTCIGRWVRFERPVTRRRRSLWPGTRTSVYKQKSSSRNCGHANRLCREFIPTIRDIMQENEDDERILNASHL